MNPFKKFENYLSIHPIYSYNETDEEIQLDARQALQEANKLLKACSPDRKIWNPQIFYFGYLQSFLVFIRLLKRKDYCSAFNELGSLAHYYRVLQPRIYYLLLDALSNL